MKIVLAQYYTSNVSYGHYSEDINREYCQKYGYTYVVEKDDSKIRSTVEDRHPTWYKSKLLLEIFKNESPDWVLFLDADAIIDDFNQKIEDFIDDNYNLILSDDVGHHSDYNAGVILIKNCDWSIEFLNNWFESSNTFTGGDAESLKIGSIMPQHLEMQGVFKTLLWHDQTCLTLLSRNPDIKEKIKQLSRRKFNHSEYRDGSFIFHAYGKGQLPYRTLDICHNYVFADKSPKENLNLVVYHASAFGDYINVCTKQFERLSKSGVYDWADKIIVTFISPDSNFDEFKKLVSAYSKVELYTFTENTYEFPAIEKIWEYSQNYDGKVLYFHSKGVWNKFKNNSDNKLSDWKIKGVGLWKEMMEFFLIDNYKDCISKLDEVDQCGMTCDHSYWWWGNFWWSNLKWIRHNSKPVQGTRWDYEGWINRGRPAPTVHEFYHIDYNPYYTVLPEDIHINSYAEHQIEVTGAYYGVLGEQQDEGYPILERTVNDVTDIIKENVEVRNNKSISIPVNNSLFGDPIFGHRKMLEVNFIVDGKDYVLVQYENFLLNFDLK